MAKKHDEVRAMTDEQLRFKASELMGITDGAIPDYTNDIASAWELVEVAREREWWWSSSYKTSTRPDGEYGPLYEVRFRCVGRETISNHVCEGLSLPKAITRAFILAMDDS